MRVDLFEIFLSEISEIYFFGISLISVFSSSSIIFMRPKFYKAFIKALRLRSSSVLLWGSIRFLKYNSIGIIVLSNTRRRIGCT